jgi:hypothetical protein
MVWIWSPICQSDEADEATVLRAQRDQSSFFGVILFDEGYALGSVAGLTSLDGDGVIRVIRMITEFADEIEKQVLGGQDGFTANIAPKGGDAPVAGAGFCIQCGAARVPGAGFCASCGSRLA